MKPSRAPGAVLMLLGVAALVGSIVSYSPPPDLRPAPALLAFIGPLLLAATIVALPIGWRMLREPNRARWPLERSQAAKALSSINSLATLLLIAGIVIFAGRSRIYDPSYRLTLAFLTLVVGATIPFLGRWLLKVSAPDRPTP